MRKLIVAAAVATLASLGAYRHLNAQAFYPGPIAGTPATRGSYDPYPGTYGSYPRQSPSAAKSQRDHDRYAQDRRDDHNRRASNDKRRRDNDRDDRYGQYGQNGEYGESGQYGQSRYGTRSTDAPSRIAAHTPVTNSSRRDWNWDRR